MQIDELELIALQMQNLELKSQIIKHEYDALVAKRDRLVEARNELAESSLDGTGPAVKSA